MRGGLILVSTFLTTDVSKIREGLLEPKLYLVTDISDQGEGISAENQEYLFETFKKLRNGSKVVNKDMSIGVGLSCSKVLVNALGGDIFVLRSDRTGTCIRYYIPVNMVSKDQFDSQ